MAVEVFNNPFNGSPTVWNAQGALVTWSPGANSAIAASNAQNALNRLQASVQQQQNNPNGTYAHQSHVFACLTGIQIQYSRQSSTQYPIGGSAPIRILGAPNGICVLTSILGPTTDLEQFLKQAASGCNQIVVGIQPFATQNACPNATSGVQPIIMLKGCSVNQLNFNIQPQGQGISLINVPINLQFTSLTWNY